jgi:hypothetical protein
LDSRDEFPSRIPDAADRIKKSDQLRTKTPNRHTRIAKCVEFDGGVYLHLL